MYNELIFIAAQEESKNTDDTNILPPINGKVLTPAKQLEVLSEESVLKTIVDITRQHAKDRYGITL